MEAVDEKKDHIVEAALRSMLHFGMAKTTLNDIAEEAGLSNTAIYYYFGDKHQVITAVIEKILNEYLEESKHIPDRYYSLSDMLEAEFALRLEFSKRYFTLRLEEILLKDTDHRFMQLLRKALAQECCVFTAILNKAKERGEIKIDNTEDMAGLVQDVIMGLKLVCTGINPLQFEMTKEQEAHLHQRKQQFIKLLIKGLQ